jgi:hypothetical protein
MKKNLLFKAFYPYQTRDDADSAGHGDGNSASPGPDGRFDSHPGRTQPGVAAGYAGGAAAAGGRCKTGCQQ